MENSEFYHPQQKMSPALKSFIQRWVINTLAVLVAANVVRGISYDSPGGLFVASLLLGILNALLRPLLLLLSLPLVIFTLGLFVLIINAFVLYFVDLLVKPFHVDGFWAAFFGAVIISLVSLVANAVTGNSRGRVTITRKSKAPRNRAQDRDRDGTVIDV